ncbi:3-oxoacyl-[acyl-carrier-protein] reductase [Alteracholeplasma palmae J233]|uniref:3-oxoacyl-[acyl-carrier-protein] reductase n=1 Tax=Alteracholeplasma palmae (strain ATCC 49389 / J233) TaxID=1318466 RepID=U4KL91_ALTPJ|nr:3-oxoacyl-[acyl-carrier-protein] reductase [Alteracholeplasma palmae]CCV64669.1 3-oxoacyl-[acyl-carrier-protein] reductase [Alteracholeplasma palmae J233]
MSDKKVALITGGTTGIGKAIAHKLAISGYDIALNYYVGDEQAASVVKELEAFNVRVIAIKADVSKYQEVEQMVKEVVTKLGNLNIVVNNAGITDDALILRMQEEQFDRVISTNLKGVWNVCRHVSKVLLKSGYGRIINISSVTGIMGNAGQSNYSAAKAGVIGITKTLARELASRSVTVNAVAPGFIQTQMTDKLPETIINNVLEQIPLKKLGHAEDIANAVAFLASPDASYITGQVISIDGGLAM